MNYGLISITAIVLLTKYIQSPTTYAKWIIAGFEIRNLGDISYNKMLQVFDKKEEDLKTGKTLENIKTLSIKNLNFKYDTLENSKSNINNKKILKNKELKKSLNILDNINLEVEKNDVIGLVGKTGSGKTTLVNLICRFYETNEGEIEINGENIKKYSIESLRNKIGYVMQKFVIFNGTIFENINYSVNEQIDKEKIISICKKLNLHEKIMMQEKGYETIINSDTAIFSEGEKQLLNFSRIMLLDPEIIILDEPTSSLSIKAEREVREIINKIVENKICFIIAHRLSTIEKCTKIVFMENGKIKEEGTHNELINKKGDYYNLLNLEK